MTDFPPKNRRDSSLPILRIEVEDANNVQVFDPNSIVLWEIRGGVDRLAPVSITGHPFVTYRSDDIEMRLSPAQLGRLIRLDLTSDEYFQIRLMFGMAHEWHEDFYDPDSGEALQPRRP